MRDLTAIILLSAGLGFIFQPEAQDSKADFNVVVEKGEHDATDCPDCNGKGYIVIGGGQCPLCKGVGKYGIKWVKEAEAKKSPKDDWYFVTMGQDCASCVQLEKLHHNPIIVAATRNYDCVLIKDPPRGSPWLKFYTVKIMPADVFVKPSGRWTKMDCENGVPDMPQYLTRFYAGHRLDEIADR